MTKYDLTRLRDLAEKAAPKEWVCDSRRYVRSKKGNIIALTQGAYDGNINRMESIEYLENAAFIAAANPQTILALIDKIESLQSTLDTCRDKNSQLEKEADWLASYIGKHECKDGKPEVTFCATDKTCASCWRKEARKAVEAGDG